MKPLSLLEKTIILFTTAWYYIWYCVRGCARPRKNDIIINNEKNLVDTNNNDLFKLDQCYLPVWVFILGMPSLALPIYKNIYVCIISSILIIVVCLYLTYVGISRSKFKYYTLTPTTDTYQIRDQYNCYAYIHNKGKCGLWMGQGRKCEENLTRKICPINNSIKCYILLLIEVSIMVIPMVIIVLLLVIFAI